MSKVFMLTLLIAFSAVYSSSASGQTHKGDGPDLRERLYRPHPSVKRGAFSTAPAQAVLAGYMAQADDPPKSTPPPAATANQNQQEAIRKILFDQSIWGKDFGAALKAIPLLSENGEQKVLIFGDRLIGTTPYQKNDIQAAMSIRRATRDLNADISAMKRQGGAQSDLGTAQALSFPDDDSQRIAMFKAGNQYLAPNTSIVTIKEHHGTPQKITKEAVKSTNQYRPEVLIYHHYANSAVIFVTSNIRNSGYVNRVILSAPAVQAALADR